MNLRTAIRWAITLWGALIFLDGVPLLLAHTKSKQDSQMLRSDYVARMQQEAPAGLEKATLGSLYLPNGALTDMTADYKARRVDDVVTLVVFEQTTATSTGDVNSQRSFQTSSAITA